MDMRQSSLCSFPENARSVYFSVGQEVLQTVKSGFRSIGMISSSIKSSLGLTASTKKEEFESEDELTSLCNRNIYEWTKVDKRNFIPTSAPDVDQSIPVATNPFYLVTDYLTESMKSLSNSVMSSLGSLHNAEDDDPTASISSHLSLMNSISEDSLREGQEKLPYTSYWPRDILRTYVHNLTERERQNWIDRIRDWEFKLGNMIRQQVIFNGYKFFCKACFFLMRSQMPEAMGDAFNMLDHERRCYGEHRPF
ncbi:hypothetical protein M3P05_02795 [Sansalvadorimonas sp. 2012CJ34-2]|uniref:Uncharacterized protein n=1 Tax=Parendozoicomonas callyspongiae TaxID=2942213 RepID=A0ABT0PBW9_9GAMM|nr:hypothetical protein [Sansalvadorimonas sp. 2012CJ34-2]MCL6268878.1 hypothetical protein [Sansalvadorimonas sp. 2012CJ34-2]